jgi:hypothetical protein
LDERISFPVRRVGALLLMAFAKEKKIKSMRVVANGWLHLVYSGYWRSSKILEVGEILRSAFYLALSSPKDSYDRTAQRTARARNFWFFCKFFSPY